MTNLKGRALIFRSKPVQYEAAEQAAVIQWANLLQNAYPELKLLFAIPNGHGIHLVTRLKMAREGVKSGIPDLFLPSCRGRWNGLFIEMKSAKGRLSDNQKRIFPMLRKEGYFVGVCWSSEEAIQLLQNYLGNRLIEKGDA